MRVAASPSITPRRCYGTHWAREPPAAEVLVLVHAIAERCQKKKKSMYLLFGTFFVFVREQNVVIFTHQKRWSSMGKKALYSGTKKINQLNMQSQPTQPPHLHVISVLCLPPTRPVGVCFVPGLVNLLFGCTYDKYYYIFLNRFEYINTQNMKRKEKKFLSRL